MNAQEKAIQHTIWRDQEAEKIEASKARMANEHGLERNAKFELAWKMAWEDGHSSGIGDVEQIFGELAELLK